MIYKWLFFKYTLLSAQKDEALLYDWVICVILGEGLPCFFSVEQLERQ